MRGHWDVEDLADAAPWRAVDLTGKRSHRLVGARGILDQQHQNLPIADVDPLFNCFTEVLRERAGCSEGTRAAGR